MDYLKVGRGGAGNYYSPQDVQQAAIRAREEDLESQRQAVPAATSSQLQSQPSTTSYTSSGRGGAGNLTSSSSERDTLQGLESNASATSTSTSSVSRPNRHYGRGGAGNFDFKEEEKAPPLTKTDWDRRDVEGLEGVRPPEEAHLPALGREKEVEA